MKEDLNSIAQHDGDIKTDGERVDAPTDISAMLSGARFPQIRDSIIYGVNRISTGFHYLDTALTDGDGHGFVEGSFVVLGGPPKSGKSTLAQAIARNIIDAGGWVYHLDFENGARRFYRRLLCSTAQIPPMLLRNQGAMDDGQKARWAKVLKQVAPGGDIGRRLLYDEGRRDGCPLDADALRADVVRFCDHARQQASEHDGRNIMLVVDSLQKLPFSNGARRDSIDVWLRQFEAIRSKENIVVLVISELKRDKDGGYTGAEATFKESGDIEYTGDLLLMMRRKSERDNGELPTQAEAAEGATWHGPASVLKIKEDRDGARRRDVAEYRSVYPYYGIMESPLAASEKRDNTATVSRRIDGYEVAGAEYR